MSAGAGIWLRSNTVHTRVKREPKLESSITKREDKHASQAAHGTRVPHDLAALLLPSLMHQTGPHLASRTARCPRGTALLRPY